MTSFSTRLLKNLNTFLTPRFLRQLDHYLLLHWPLLWRTNLVNVFWFVGLSTAGTTILGYIIPMSSQNTWARDQIETAYSGLQLVSLGVIGIWAYLQIRVKVGERTFLEYVGISFINTVAIFLMLFPSSAFVIGVTFSIAKVLPDKNFEREYAYHHRHNFWCCDIRINDELVNREYKRLQDSLMIFGLKMSRILRGQDYFEREQLIQMCQVELPCIEIGNLDGNVVPTVTLENRLNSIKHSKALWQSGTGAYFHRYVKILKWNAFFSLVISIVISIFSYPVYAYRRRFIKSSQFRNQLDIKLWQPSWLRRLDQKWLRENPTIWATRFHTFLYQSLTLGTAIVVLALVIFSVSTDKTLLNVLKRGFDGNKTLLIPSFIFLGSASPIAWALMRRRIFIPATSISKCREMVGKFFLAALPLPIIIMLFGVLTGAFSVSLSKIDDTVAIAILVYFGGSFVICWSVVRNYLRAKETAISCAIGLVVLIFPFFVLDSLSVKRETGLLVCFIFPLLWALINWGLLSRLTTRGTIRRVALTSASLIMSIPAVLFYIWLGIDGFFDGTLKFSSNDARFISGFFLVCLSFFSYRHWLSRPMVMLVKGRFDPGER